jgi:phosphopantothenoylcysteine decarboxylase
MLTDVSLSSSCHIVSKYRVLIEVVATKASLEFYNPEKVIEAGARVWVDEDEWRVSLLLLDPIMVNVCN